MISVIFTLSVMSSDSLHSFDCVLTLRWNRIVHSPSVGLLAGPGCSAAIVVSYAFPFFDVCATVTEMVFPFWRTVVHCCTGSMLASDTATVAMLGHAGSCEYVRTEVGAEAGRGTCMWRGCSVIFPAAYCLGV